MPAAAATLCCRGSVGQSVESWPFVVQARLRTIMIDMVLATDMKQHVQLHTSLQTHLTVAQVPPEDGP